MQPLPSTPLAELLNQPDLGAILRTEGLGLERPDAGQTLAEACEAAGLSVLDTLRQMEAARLELGRGPAAWQAAPLEEVAAHILTRHHGYVRAELPRLGRLLEVCISKAVEDVSLQESLEKIRAHFRFLNEDIVAHLDLEEESLFAQLLEGKGGPGDWREAILSEHTAVEELFQNIATLTSHYTCDADSSPDLRALYLGLRDLEEDLQTHIFLENEVLFPRSLGVPPDPEAEAEA